MKVSPVDVLAKRVIAHLVEPARKVGDKTCSGSGQVDRKREAPQHAE